MANNEAITYNYLTKTLGYSHAVASAFMGNILTETEGSPFDPESYNSKEGALGICQWRGSRLTNLRNYSGSNAETISGQLSFLGYELTQGEKKRVGNQLTSWSQSGETDVAMIANYIRSDFEVAAVSSRTKRETYALQYYDGGVDTTTVANISDELALISNTSNLAETIDYHSLSYEDPYSNIIKENLSKLSSISYEYGYLIDITNGGEFKFYVPEFTEQAGVNWNNIDIPGRSVTVMSYSSTNSRSIAVKLDLYAGEGLYVGNDPVTDLHNDANFLKSLEYPDYTNSIARPPASVHLILGSAINIVGVVKDVVIEHRKPLDSSRRSMYLNVSFTVVQQAIDPIDYTDVRAGRYYLDTSDSETGIASESAAINIGDIIKQN